jgi:hypothetical protein
MSNELQIAERLPPRTSEPRMSRRRDELRPRGRYEKGKGTYDGR